MAPDDGLLKYHAVLAAPRVEEGLRRRAVRGGGATIGSQAAQLVVQLGSTMVLARLLVPEDFGLVAMVASLTGLITLVKDLGLSQAVVQRATITHEQVSALFWLNLSASAVLALGWAWAAPLIAAFYSEPRLEWIAIAYASFIVLSGAGVQHKALLSRQMRFARLASGDVIALVGASAAAMALAASGFGYWALVAVPGIQAGASTVLHWLWCPWRPGRPGLGKGVGSLLRFGAGVTGFNLANYLARNADDVLIGRQWGTGPLGLYSRAYSILLQPLSRIQAPVEQVAVPTLSRLIDDPTRYRQAYLRMLRATATPSIMIIAFSVATADWIIAIVLGGGWEEAVPIFRWLGLAGLLQPVAHTAGALFISQGRTADLFRWGLAGSSIAVASFLIGLPFGPEGVAAAYALGGVLIRTPALFWYAGRRGSVRTADFYRAVTLPFVLAAGIGLSVVSLRALLGDVGPLIGLPAAAVLSLIATAAFLTVLPAGRALAFEMRHAMGDLRAASAAASRTDTQHG